MTKATYAFKLTHFEKTGDSSIIIIFIFYLGGGVGGWSRAVSLKYVVVHYTSVSSIR
jgi:hypothetical protein